MNKQRKWIKSYLKTRILRIRFRKRGCRTGDETWVLKWCMGGWPCKPCKSGLGDVKVTVLLVQKIEWKGLPWSRIPLSAVKAFCTLSESEKHTKPNPFPSPFSTNNSNILTFGSFFLPQWYSSSCHHLHNHS